jgi:hypothetical protein
LLPVGEQKMASSSITLLEYGPQQLHETRFDTVTDGLSYQPSQPVLWLNVYGLHDPAVMQAIGERFDCTRWCRKTFSITASVPSWRTMAIICSSPPGCSISRHGGRLVTTRCIW